jgi:hypothetical protein
MLSLAMTARGTVQVFKAVIDENLRGDCKYWTNILTALILPMCHALCMLPCKVEQPLELIDGGDNAREWNWGGTDTPLGGWLLAKRATDSRFWLCEDAFDARFAELVAAFQSARGGHGIEADAACCGIVKLLDEGFELHDCAQDSHLGGWVKTRVR